VSDYYNNTPILEGMHPVNVSRRALLELLAPLVADLDGTPQDEEVVIVRGHQPLIVRMPYAVFLTANHLVLGELLLEHHLQDGTVLCVYRGIARPRGAIELPVGTVWPLELSGA
jgi:hypothetical protein